MEETSSHLLHTGEVVAGKYRIEGVLGAGGMATVYSAWHAELEQRVALKMLHAAHGADATTVKRFVREARNVARIQSEHVAHIMDVGRHSSGQAFMVMEYLEGSDLAVLLKQRGPLAVGDVADYLVQVCHALAVAHGMGIVHRDLKPANLFLTHRVDDTACVKVLDFGIATAFYEPPQLGELTSTTNVIGSPKYMSPEQLANAKDVDPRSDIWSLGVIAYRLLTGQLPFMGSNIVDFAMNLSIAPVPPRAHRPEIPEAFEAIVMRCMERDRERRWPDVDGLVTALAPFLTPAVSPLVGSIHRIADGNRGRSFGDIPAIEIDTSDSRILLADGPSETTQAALVPSTATMRPPEPRRSRRPLVVGIALLGSIIVVGAIAGLQLRRPTGDASLSTTRTSPATTMSAPSTAASSGTLGEAQAIGTPTTKPTVAATSTTTTAQAPPVNSLKQLYPGLFSAKPGGPKPSTSAPTKASTTKPDGPKDVWGWGE